MAYANVKETLFTGATGRELRRHPAEVRELQFWLVAGPGRDPFGIFILDLDTVAPQLGRSAKKVRESLDVLIQLGFCKWDEQTQYVWVIEMAHHQFLTPLKLTDFRCSTAQKWYAALSRNPFMGEWFDRYVEDFHLEEGKHAVERRPWVSRDGTSDAPSKPQGGGASKPLELNEVNEPSALFDLSSQESGEKDQGLATVLNQDIQLKGGEVDREFERLWAVYPRAVEKKACRAKFGVLKPTLALVEQMLAAIASQGQGDRWRNGYIPNFLTWLEKSRWLDRVDVSQPRVTPKTANTIGAAERFAERRREQG